MGVLDEDEIEFLRRMTPEQRLQRSLDLRAAEIAVTRDRIRREHPNADEHELEMRLFSSWHDAETMRRVWGWQPAAADE